MEWSEEDSLLLIKEYHNRPILWDLAHPLHYHKIKRNDAWAELSQITGKGPKDCKKKWDNLLASFRREKGKLTKVSTGKDAEEVYNRSWYAFEALRFLLNKNKPQKSLSTIEREDKNSQQGLNETSVLNQEHGGAIIADEEDTENHEQELEVNRLTPESTPIRTGAKVNRSKSPKQRRIEEEKRLDGAFQLSKSCSTPKTEHDADIFGKYVASKLKQYDRRTRSFVESKVLEAVLEADRGTFNIGISDPRYYQSPTIQHQPHMFQPQPHMFQPQPPLFQPQPPLFQPQPPPFQHQPPPFQHQPTCNPTEYPSVISEDQTSTQSSSLSTQTSECKSPTNSVRTDDLRPEVILKQ